MWKKPMQALRQDRGTENRHVVIDGQTPNPIDDAWQMGAKDSHEVS